MTTQSTEKYTVESKAMGKLRMAAVRDGLSVAGMDLDQLVEHYHTQKGCYPDGVTLTANGGTAPTAPLEKPQPKPEPQPKAAEPKQEPQPPVAGDQISQAITAAITAALAQVQPAAPAIDENQIIALIDKHAFKRIEVSVDKAEPVKVEGPQHEAFEEVLTYIAAGLNVYMPGPAGCGKTTLARNLAKSLDRPFYFSGAVVQEHKLTGYMDANGNYVATDFFRAFTEGGVFLLDEIDAGFPGPLLWANAAIDNRIADFPHGQFEAHPDFVCIAAANTYGSGADREYVGRNQLDAATLDRFAFVAMDYDEKLERALCPDQNWCKQVQKLRATARKLKVRHVISTRAVRDGAKLLAAGAPQERVEAAVVWKGLDSATIAKITQGAA